MSTESKTTTKCHACVFYKGTLLKQPCDKHWNTLTDIQIMIIGYCHKCNRSIISWNAHEWASSSERKCACHRVPKKDRLLVEKCKWANILVVDKDNNRSEQDFNNDLRELDRITNGFATKRIQFNASAWVRTFEGYEEIGTHPSGFETQEQLDNLPIW